MTPRNPQDKKTRLSLCGEWEKQEAVWLAWPSDETLWGENFRGAQKAILNFARVIDRGQARVHLLVPDTKRRREAEERFGAAGIKASIEEIPFGDIWLRDIAPLFARNARGELATLSFTFNGWGGKYILPGDREVSEKIARLLSASHARSSLVLEGGAIESNGQGTLLTTRECLLNSNRNPGTSQAEMENELRDLFDLRQILWLTKGLRFDHTDGHIDNIARFVHAEQILCMEPTGSDDPQRENLQGILKEVRALPFEVATLPSPGRVVDGEGNILPASYLNFLITNDQVAVPVFQSSHDDRALRRLSDVFPNKNITGIDCLDLLTGGGTLHCVSQPQFFPLGNSAKRG